MYIKNLNTCKEITSGDNCRLREILNPLRDGLSVGYSLAHASVGPGETTFKHTLTSSEVYYILSGISIPRSHIPVCRISLVTFDNARRKFRIPASFSLRIEKSW